MRFTPNQSERLGNRFVGSVSRATIADITLRLSMCSGFFDLKSIAHSESVTVPELGLSYLTNDQRTFTRRAAAFAARLVLKLSHLAP